MLRNKMWWTLLMLLACPVTTHAADLQKKIDPQKQVMPIDQIIAVVNDDVITRRELDNRLDIVVRQLQKQGTPLPAISCLTASRRI